MPSCAMKLENGMVVELENKKLKNRVKRLWTYFFPIILAIVTRHVTKKGVPQILISRVFYF